MAEKENAELLRGLLRKRSAVKGSLTKLYNKYPDIQALQYLERPAILLAEERLRCTFEKYESLNMEIVALDPSVGDDSAEDQYMDTLTYLRQALLNLEREQKGIQTMPTKLPQINIPVFSGKYSEFKSFTCLFDSLIHSNKAMDNVQKLYYLRNFLQGEPLDLITNLTISNESYGEARKILFDRYDNVYKITNEHISILLDMPPITKSTSSNIRNFLSQVKQQLAALKNLSHPIDKWDPILLCILTRKLDLLCRREFQLCRHQDPEVTHLIEFLEKRALALENAEQTKQQSSERVAPKAAHIATVSEQRVTANSNTGATASPRAPPVKKCILSAAA